mmetsp:Transcript_158299/g.507708  ORF Transcript_158299/g.507708 Transcript_158299/m.507708 type:complete len:246 (-) Transcript_158299:53-790(-)
MQGPEAGPDLGRELLAGRQELLALGVAEAVHAVGARGIEELFTGGVRNLAALCALNDRDWVESLVDHLLEDRVHALESGGLKAQIGEVLPEVLRDLSRFGPALLPRLFHACQGLLAPLRDVLCGRVSPEELVPSEVPRDDELAEEAPENRRDDCCLQCLEEQEAIPSAISQRTDEDQHGDHRHAGLQQPLREDQGRQALQPALHEDRHGRNAVVAPGAPLGVRAPEPPGRRVAKCTAGPATTLEP